MANSNEIFNESLDTSFIESPSFAEDGKRKISLSRRIMDGRKSLASFNRTDENQQKQQQHHDDRQELGVTLDSLHEINSRSFNPNKAFAYDFINKIDAFLVKYDNRIDFKIIGMSIEAGTKLYTSKVGVVFTNTQKISSSLSMATEEQNYLGFDEDGILDDDDLRQNNERRKRKKQRKNINTIASNIETLNGKLETNIEIDPLFHHLSAAFDVGNVNSLLMANLCVNPHGAMLLDSNSSLNFDSFPNITSTLMDFPFLKPEHAFENSYVCQPYSNFEFLRRDINTNMEEFTSQKHDTVTNLNYDFDINADVEDINEPVDFDFDNFHTPDFSIQDQEARDTSDFESENILQFLPENNDSNQFFNRNFLKKAFKNVSRYHNLKYLNKKPASKRTRTTYIENIYDFDVSDEKFRPSDNSLFSKQTLSKWVVNSKEKKIEDNHHDFSSNKLKACFTRDCDFIGLVTYHNVDKRSKTEMNSVNNDDTHGDDGIMNDDFYPYEDENVRHQSNIILNDVDERPGFNLDTNTETHNFDTEPIHVDALDIDYAKVAKKIDIKRVKTSMWDLIKQGNVEKLNLSQKVDSQLDHAYQTDFTFFSLRKNLAFLLNQNLNENLSTPISFVALLHLCNERNLQLKTEQLDNFMIETS